MAGGALDLVGGAACGCLLGGVWSAPGGLLGVGRKLPGGDDEAEYAKRAADQYSMCFTSEGSHKWRLHAALASGILRKCPSSRSARLQASTYRPSRHEMPPQGGATKPRARHSAKRRH